ncbi:MAG: hypothetical protein KU37_09025 [Sulfuricurvum sp. PC08-66]|nr:MAG: hypothetical protein KU37_09025 [Sulfuricurvum sp. PC08-66]
MKHIGLMVAMLAMLWADAKDDQIKALERELAIKKQEIQILLIAIKNQKQESIQKSNAPSLSFQSVDTPAPTKVILKPSMLSEEAISAIDRENQTDTDTLMASAPTQNTDVVAPEATQATTPEESPEESEAVQQEATTDTIASRKESHAPSTIAGIIYTKPTKYHLIEKATIFSDLGQSRIEEWEKERAFTSNRRKGEWILVTGRITSRGWEMVEKSMWIHQSHVK